MEVIAGIELARGSGVAELAVGHRSGLSLLCSFSCIPPQVLVLVLLATLAAKALLEGFDTLPRYCPRYGKRTLACFVAGFAVFPLPELFPSELLRCLEPVHTYAVAVHAILSVARVQTMLAQRMQAPRAGAITVAASQSPPPPLPQTALPADHYWFFHSLWHVFMAEAFHLLYLQLEGAHLQRQGSSNSEFLASQLSSGSWASAAALLQPAQRLVRTRRRAQGQGVSGSGSQSASESGSQGGSPRMFLRSGKKVW